ncbi:hypothetical protein JCM24511_04424 [Saitozyma sp. JCM 24511]|nr:hypothetical protein JCM24511_04424 [Saitozyma sp. JCM 24511]
MPPPPPASSSTGRRVPPIDIHALGAGAYARPTPSQARRRNGRRRVLAPPPPPESGLKTNVALFSYALSRLPPRQLPLLALYASAILHLTSHGWLPREALGKTGAAIVGVLSMVTGLLLSYRFSSAMSKWDEGKKVWVDVRTTIRDGIRMSPRGTPQKAIGTPARDQGSYRKTTDSSLVDERVDELAGLLVGFAFALQHHLHGSRPLPQPPLCDLLPLSYLSSLKRTEARVRFAENHAGPSGSTSILGLSEAGPTSPTLETSRPGLRRRSTGPPTKEEREAAGEADDEWEIQSLRTKAEEAVAKLAEAVSLGGASDPTGLDAELRQQLSQLNVPRDISSGEEDGTPGQGVKGVAGEALSPGKNSTPSKGKSNLYSPYPANLPLALLKLMEVYVCGLAEVPAERGGWSEAKRERALGFIKSLSGSLGEAERLCANPPPLPLTLHLSHLTLIYLAALPCSLLCVVNSWPLVLITIIAGWCLLGLEALVAEVGGVFGGSGEFRRSYSPSRRFKSSFPPKPSSATSILLESLEASPAFHRFYRSRVVGRVGEDDSEVAELDRRGRRGGGEEWVPTFN